jgi:hypothetical protein
MITPRLVSCVSLLSLAICTWAKADPIKHEFLAIDEGLSNLLYINEANPAKNYVISIAKPHPRDMQLEGDGKLLISHDEGYCEYEIATGKRLKDVSTFHDVSSSRRLENGNLLLAGVDFDQEKKNKGDNPVGDPTGRHILLVEYTPEGKEVRRQTYVGDYLRLLRETAAGTYLFSCNTMFREADKNGNYLKDFPVEGFKHAWKALRLPNGNTVMSGGYGAFMAEVDSSGKLVRKFGDKENVAPEVHPNFYALFQLLPNGNIVAANWQGHGKGHGTAGKQIVEFTPDSKIVWTWSDSTIISSIQAVLVLDGLDISKRYDERTGVMAPIAAK